MDLSSTWFRIQDFHSCERSSNLRRSTILKVHSTALWILTTGRRGYPKVQGIAAAKLERSVLLKMSLLGQYFAKDAKRSVKPMPRLARSVT